VITLTEHAKNPNTEAASKEAGAPGKEIEITPEMIEAGKYALASFNVDYESHASAAERVFLAMLSARRIERHAS
jgi:DNA gyrase inhibitor GyrI